jgi:hypothetical protein
MGGKIYMALHHHRFSTAESYMVSWGGALNGIAERTMTVLSHDWSRPAFDGFGLPVDGVPPADASLVGGTPGEPSYEYYLRSAKEASQEATQAVQKAIDNLVDETLYGVQRDAAEQRAQSIADIEHQALCGRRSNCDIPRIRWAPTVPSCGGLSVPAGPACSFAPTCSELVPTPIDDQSEQDCERARGQLLELLPEFSVAEEVITAGGIPPVFSDLAGSEAQRVLMREWNAVQGLQRAVNQAMDGFRSVALQSQAARNSVPQAECELGAAKCDFWAKVTAVGQGGVELEQRKAELAVQEQEIVGRRALLLATEARECSDKAYKAAMTAGWSYSGGETNVWLQTDATGQYLIDEQAMTVTTKGRDRDNKSWGFGPLMAQMSKCIDARDQLRISDHIYARQEEEKLIEKRREVLEFNTQLLQSQVFAAISGLGAAEARRNGAASGANAAIASAHSQIAASLTQVQTAVGELAAASVEMAQARLKETSATASANVERDLALRDLGVRFGLQRKFRSYDMWRARALIEGARRMAIAARRAIEARFVVDLSDLQTPQAFVDSPAIWADEVYGNDLNAPAVVGLTLAPKLEGAVYPNQLLDYVGNLERFVKGYTMSYPTSVAAPDTEVVTLPGPELTEELTRLIGVGESVEEAPVSVLSGSATGWTFYCPDTSTWQPHPGVGQVPLTSRVSSMCPGNKAPTRMRFGFGLDPWARRDGSITNAPLVQRHNVRWRQLAVNLVGTGIRDCRTAGNSEQCFAESFLRFQLRHSGPAWAMNHSQQWRAFDLPAAFIEGGKALTSEEWLDPIANSWTAPFVANVARAELTGRPVNGAYELIIELSPDVRIDRIQQIQLLVETDYWVRQQ